MVTRQRRPGDRVADAVARAVAYPTNFVKEIEGKNTNVYHAIHVRRLLELYDITRYPKLAEWAHRWESYMCEWARMPTYDGLATITVTGSTAPVEAVGEAAG